MQGLASWLNDEGIYRAKRSKSPRRLRENLSKSDQGRNYCGQRTQQTTGIDFYSR